jgi:hypothetical protein
MAVMPELWKKGAKDPFRADKPPIGSLYIVFVHCSHLLADVSCGFRMDKVNDDEDGGTPFCFLYSPSRPEVVWWARLRNVRWNLRLMKSLSWLDVGDGDRDGDGDEGTGERWQSSW